MNKKGFTLIELLAVIVLLGTLSIIAGVSFSGMNERQKKKNYDEFISKIENAGCTFVEMISYSDSIVTTDGKKLKDCKGTECKIPVEILIKYGFLSGDLKIMVAKEGNTGYYTSDNKLSVTCAKEGYNNVVKYSSSYVTVTWNDGAKTCSLNSNTVAKAECPDGYTEIQS